MPIPAIVDFEQPRVLYTKVMSDTDRKHLIQNIAGNIGNVKSAEIKARQRRFLSLSHQNLSYLMPVAVAVFAAVDQGLSDAVAKAIGAPPVKPLVIAPASSVVPLKMNIGQQTVAIA